MLDIALPKGRLGEKVYKMLKDSGYEVTECAKLRDVWETSKKSGIHITGLPPARMIYSARFPE